MIEITENTMQRVEERINELNAKLKEQRSEASLKDYELHSMYKRMIKAQEDEIAYLRGIVSQLISNTVKKEVQNENSDITV
jgi:hypothetical protein